MYIGKFLIFIYGALEKIIAELQGTIAMFQIYSTCIYLSGCRTLAQCDMHWACIKKNFQTVYWHVEGRSDYH